jgi:hypothetical protein
MMDPDDVVLDPTIVTLVRSLHAFGGIRTLGSAGLLADASAHQTGVGTWSVLFQVAHTAAGWFALEFLAWLSSITRFGLTRTCGETSPRVTSSCGSEQVADATPCGIHQECGRAEI